MDRIVEDHESLIKVILEEEEELIQCHRQHIDDLVEIARKDMNLLHAVDQPQSDVEQYVRNLDRVLLDKMDMIGKMRQKLVTFYTHLRQEENLQKLY
jgi:kinesin family protein 2/24